MDKIIDYFKQNIHTISLFLLVGTLTAFVYFALFALFWNGLHIHYNAAVSISYISAVVFHFTANRYVTFKSQHQPLAKQLYRYSLMTLFNYLMTIAIVYFIVERCLLSPYLGILISIGVTVNAGFIMSRYWVFQRSRHCDI